MIMRKIFAKIRDWFWPPYPEDVSLCGMSLEEWAAAFQAIREKVATDPQVMSCPEMFSYYERIETRKYEDKKTEEIIARLADIDKTRMRSIILMWLVIIAVVGIQSAIKVLG